MGDLAVYAGGKVFRPMTLVIVAGKERTKISFSNVVGYTIDDWKLLGADIHKNLQTCWEWGDRRIEIHVQKRFSHGNEWFKKNNYGMDSENLSRFSLIGDDGGKSMELIMIVSNGTENDFMTHCN